MTRVLLVALPELLQELVRKSLSQAPDIEVVGETEDADVDEAVATARADAIIVTSEAARGLATRRPELAVLELSGEGGQAFLWKGGKRVALGELSPDLLLEALG